MNPRAGEFIVVIRLRVMSLSAERDGSTIQKLVSTLPSGLKRATPRNTVALLSLVVWPKPAYNDAAVGLKGDRLALRHQAGRRDDDPSRPECRVQGPVRREPHDGELIEAAGTCEHLLPTFPVNMSP